MPGTSSCLPCCSTPVVTNTPGPQGNGGPQGNVGPQGPQGPAGPLAGNNNFGSYAVGTVYSLTNAVAQIVFGTTSPQITITAAGTYLIFARVRYDYTGATFAAVRTATTKLRRTNNTAADLPNTTTTFKTQIVATITYTAEIQGLEPTVYTTTNINDIIQLWAGLDVAPTAGSFDCVEASIVAVRIA